MYSISNLILDLLINKICTKENSLSANKFIQQNRKLNSFNFLEIPYLTQDISKFVELNNGILKKDWLSHSLFFPIRSLKEDKIIGFDVRYIGESKDRTRYYKIKLENSSLFNYGVKDYLKLNSSVIITEGVFDLETLRHVFKESSFSFLSPLTCTYSPSYLEFLLCSFDNLIFAYDNDSAGEIARFKIKKFASENQISNIHFLSFLGKDINDSFVNLGDFSLVNGLKSLELKKSLT